MTDIDAWIEREFSGHGRALRRIDEPPLPDEPWMAMSDAKNIVRGVLKENEWLRAIIHNVALSIGIEDVPLLNIHKQSGDL